MCLVAAMLVQIWSFGQIQVWFCLFKTTSQVVVHTSNSVDASVLIIIALVSMV